MENERNHVWGITDWRKEQMKTFSNATSHTGDIVDEALHGESSILRLKTDSGTEDVHYPVFYEGLPEEYKLVAERDLGETPAKKEKGLRTLKEFMKKENLSGPDDILIAVLRSCKYDLKKSQLKLKSFLSSRRKVIEKLCQLDNKKIDLILEDTIISLLPYRDKHGRVIVVTKPTMRFDLYSMDDLEPLAMATMLYILTFPMTTVCGMCYIADCKSDSLFVFYPIAKGFKPYIYFTLDLPVRIGKVDITYENIIARLFYNAIRPILPSKVTKRISFNGHSYKSLHTVYHPDILPKDFEGNGKPISSTFDRERLLNFIQTLREEGKRTITDPSVT